MYLVDFPLSQEAKIQMIEICSKLHIRENIWGFQQMVVPQSR